MLFYFSMGNSEMHTSQKRLPVTAQRGMLATCFGKKSSKSNPILNYFFHTPHTLLRKRK